MIHARVRVVVGVLVALLAWSAPAAAQGDPQGQLRQLIADITNFVATQSHGEATLQTSRPPETRMDGGTAIATLPDVTIAGRNGDKVELGTLTLSQHEVARGRLRYELSLPERIRAVERSGNTPLTITSDGGTLAVVRDVASGMLYEADFRIRDLHVPPPTPGSADTTIGELELGWAITGRADGLSDAVTRIALHDLHAVDPTRGIGTTAGQASISYTIQGFRLEDIEAIRRAFVEGVAAGPAVGWQRAMQRLVAVMQAGGVAGGGAELTVADGVYTDGNQAPAVTIGRASLAGVSTGTNQAVSTFQLRYEQDGLVLRQGLAPLPQYIPSRVNLNLTLEQIPTAALHAFNAATAAAPGNTAAHMAALGTMLQALIQAGTTLRIAPIDVAAPAVGGTLNGTVTADARSPLQARASGELVVRGLEAVQRELAAQGGQGASSPAGVVAMLTALGQQGTGSDGQPVRTYRIELSSEGQLMLNGTDMTALLGGAGRAPARGPAGQAPAQPAAPPAAAPAPQPRGK